MSTRFLLSALLGAAIPVLAHAQTADAGEICWALADSAQPTEQVAARIAAERCQHGDALVVLGLTAQPLSVAAGFCDLAHPVTVQPQIVGGQPLYSLLCVYSGQRRMGRNGQERPHGR